MKGANNPVTLTLTQDFVAIGSSYTSLVVEIGPVTLTRSANGNGVSLLSGVLTLNPGQINDDITNLIAGEVYRVVVRVVHSGAQQGQIYGGDDSEDVRVYLNVSEPMS